MQNPNQNANHLLLAWPEYEDALEEELESLEVNFEKLSDVCFLVPQDSIQVIPAFARQCLPEVEILENFSIRQTAEAISTLVPKEGSWKLHLFEEAPGQDLEKSGRNKLIEDSLREVLKKNDRFGLKRFVDELNPEADVLIQCLSISKETIAISKAEVKRSDNLAVRSGIGGRVFIEEDKRPPARAYRKLLEALEISGLEIRPGEKVVDLGSSPGSWAWVCLEKGAEVTAVDRAELRSDLMNHNKSKFIMGDAFSYQPPQDSDRSQVDWLISDIIAAPERIIALLKGWLDKKLMKKFCVTIKFKGDSRGDSIAALREILDGTPCIIRHLENNKNEITAIGSCFNDS